MVREKRPTTAPKQRLGDIRSFFAGENVLPTPDIDSDYDEDTIVMEPPPRAAREANNKRRRIVSHVESESDVFSLLQNNQIDPCSCRPKETSKPIAL